MCSPSGPNPHGRFLWSCPITVSAFVLRSHNNWGAGLHSDLGYLPKHTQKYTVVYLGPIRSLLDPFQVSLTIIGTSDGRSGYRGQYPPPRLDLGPDGRLASTQGIRISDWSQKVIYLTTEIYLAYYTEFPSLIGPYPSVYWSIHTPSPDYGLSHTNISVQFYMYMVYSSHSNHDYGIFHITMIPGYFSYSFDRFTNPVINMMITS